MSSRSLTLRRLGVGVAAVATVAAGMPLLLSTAANAAGPATRLEIVRVDLAHTAEDERVRATAAAGTCTPYEVRATTAQGAPADTSTVTIDIVEDPESNDHDVDFCLVDGQSVFVNAPQYTNAQNSTAPDGEDNEYNAGPSISTEPSDSGSPPAGSDVANPNEPDGASGNDPAVGDNTNNPSGADNASVLAVNGVARFGIVGLLPGASVTIDAFVDPDANRNRNSRFPNSGFEDNVVAPQKKLNFTAGGRPGSNAASDAVKSVEVSPKSSFVAVGGTHSYSAVFRNIAGDVVGGVSFARLVAISGPNAPSDGSTGTFSSNCGVSGNEGEPASCTYTPQVSGTDTISVFVNQTAAAGNTSPTIGRESTEPFDTATAETTATPVAASQARILALTPETTTVTAGQGRQFVATVTDANGAPANGVSVTFSESGPGFFRGGTITGNTSTVTFTTGEPATTTSGSGPPGPGRALAFFVTNPGDAGNNTISASITNPASTQCQQGSTATLPAGQCSDTALVTITSASASPSPGASTSPNPSPSGTASPAPSATTPTTQSGTRYRGLGSPVRVLDTRDNRGPRRNGAIVLDLSSQITDANATTAVLNVTVTNATARGFLVAYPHGTTKPGTSNVNFETNQTQANEVVVRMSSDKRVTLFVDSASAHVIADLVGSFTSTASNETGRVVTNAPDRAFDSRTTTAATRSNEVIVNLSDQLPAGATGAILNVTVTRTSARGFVTVYPTGTTRPGTSNVNFERGQTQANEVITQVGTGSNAGRVSFFIDSASAALIVDVVGAVTGNTGQTFTALSSPQRALDTRDNRGARRSGAFNLTMPSSVPADATGVILNVTATNGTRPGFVTVYPAGTANPGTSNVNFPTSLTQANEVTSGLGTNNAVTLLVDGGGGPSAHVIVDVVGYLTS